MSAARDVLRDLVEQLPEAEVPAVLAEMRRHLGYPTSVTTYQCSGHAPPARPALPCMWREVADVLTPP
jgi:hypothetical protein